MSTGTATYPQIRVTPRGEIHLHGGNLGANLYLTPDKAIRLADALVEASFQIEMETPWKKPQQPTSSNAHYTATKGGKHSANTPQSTKPPTTTNDSQTETSTTQTTSTD